MPRQTLTRLAATALLLGGLFTAYTQQPAPANLTMERVRDDLHVIFGNGGNVAVLTSDEGAILVDDKFDRDVPAILGKVKTVTDQAVRFVLNTHHHGDHSGGNALLGHTATLVAHQNARANVLKNSQPGAQHVTFARETDIYLGGKHARAIHFGRGHTNGDSVIFFPEHKVVHTGDLFVRGAPFIDYGNGGSAKEWDQTLAAILELDFDTVIPGHGAISTRADLVQWKKDYETFRSRAREVSRQGKAGEEAAAAIRLDDLAGWSIGSLQMRSLPGLLEEMSK